MQAVLIKRKKKVFHLVSTDPGPNSSSLQLASQNPQTPKCWFNMELHQPLLLFSSRLISSLLPLSSKTHRFWFAVPLPLSFFQTLMIFLYTGINQGNDPQWQKLNYTRESLVPSAWQRQFSMALRGDLASGSTVWSEENCDREQRETETWKSVQLIENDRLCLRNIVPTQLRFQDKWLLNAGNRAFDNNKTNAARFVKRITCSPVYSSVSTEKMRCCVIVCF